jgi:large subunit ribosomal protein L19
MKISPVNMESRKNLDLRVGDTVRVHQKIQEKDKTRIQQFQGLVLARKGGAEAGATFTVRRVTDGYGVEKIFPLYSPVIDKIEIVKRSKTRRAKLYNIRRQALKKISKRMKMMMVDIQSEEKIPEAEAEAEVEVEAEAEVEAEVGTGEAPKETDAPDAPDAPADTEVKEENKTEEAKEETPKEEETEEK